MPRTGHTTTRPDSKFCAACGERCTFRHTLHRARAADGEPVKGDHLLLVPRSVGGAQAVFGGPLQWSSATAVLAAVARLGYYTYPQLSLVSRASAAGCGRRNERRARQPCGHAARDLATETACDPALAAATSRARAPAGGSTGAKAAAVAIARPQAINAGKEGERAPSRQEACTEAGEPLDCVWRIR